MMSMVNKRFYCEYFGKTSDELDANKGMTWILENCVNCPEERACVKASREETRKRLT